MIVYYSGRVLAFDAQTGAPRWSHRFSGDLQRAPYQEDGLLYVQLTDSDLARSGPLYALDPASGNIKATYQPPQGGWFEAIVNNHTLYYRGTFGPGGHAENNILHVVHLPDQKPLWQGPIAPTGLLALTFSAVNGVVYAYVSDGPDQYLVAYDAQNGKQIWQSPAIGIMYYRVTATTILIYGTPGSLTSDRPNPVLYAYDAKTHRLVWHKSFGPNMNISFGGDANTLSLEFSDTSHTDPPQVKRDLIVLNIVDGKVLLQKQSIPATVLEISSGILYLISWDSKSTSDVHGDIYEKGVVDAFKLADGSLLWEWQMGVEAWLLGITII